METLILCMTHLHIIFVMPLAFASITKAYRVSSLPNPPFKEKQVHPNTRYDHMTTVHARNLPFRNFIIRSAVEEETSLLLPNSHRKVSVNSFVGKVVYLFLRRKENFICFLFYCNRMNSGDKDHVHSLDRSVVPIVAKHRKLIV